MAMTTMKDHERLDLLKEIGGTKVYEERREESLKVMKETDGRRKRIEEVVSCVAAAHASVFCLFLKTTPCCGFKVFQQWCNLLLRVWFRSEVLKLHEGAL